MDAKAIEGAQSLAESARERMPALIEKIRYRIKPIDLGGCYSLLSGYHQRLGVYDYFVEGHIYDLKQHFYTANQLEQACVGLESHSPTLATHHTFLYGLLSDSPAVINWLKTADSDQMRQERDNPRLPWFYNHMTQLVLLDKWDALPAKIEKAAQKAGKGLREKFASGQDFHSLLLKRDKTGLEQLLTNEARKRQGDPLLEDWIAEASTWRAKLCWLKGIPVQIDSPLVPMELMPIQPLAHYDDVYDFLQPGWVPPSQGIVGRVSRWLKR